VLVARAEPGADTAPLLAEIAARNRRLPDWRRAAAVLLWDAEFPRTASLKVKRDALADAIRTRITDPGTALRSLA
jgi:hypothetical protein